MVTEVIGGITKLRGWNGQMALADMVLILSAALGGGIALAVKLMRDQTRLVSGTQSCYPPCVAMPVTIIDQLKDMLANAPAGMPHPLNRFWWTIQDCDYATSELKARLEYVEDVVRQSRKSDASAVLRQMDMCWRIVEELPPTSPFGINCAPRSNNFTVEIVWQGAEAPSSPVPCERIVRTMQLLTEELIVRLNSTLTVGATKKRVAGKGLSGHFPGSQTQAKRFNRGPLGHPDMLEQTSHRPVWPSPQDFNEAIQDARIAFSDEQLRSGVPELNMMGMPKVASGAFASVYKLECPNSNWAIRCFLTPVRDQQYRYEQLTKYINGDGMDCTVDFEYVSQGIRVNGAFYPILKMEWVEGMQFHLYVEDRINRGESLVPLLNKFRSTMERLHHAGVAHGDLQHGNIIVRNGDLVLVDYDGTFVPSLSMEQSNELGHPNYQHPARSKEHFGPYLDNFSAWLIDASLVALSIDPTLWNQFDGGDECLLFRRRDLNNPDKSEVFQTLLKHKEPEIRERTRRLLSLLKQDLKTIPSLAADGSELPPWKALSETTIKERTTGPASDTSKSTTEKATRLPDWLAGDSV